MKLPELKVVAWKATDPCDLERKILDPNIAKSEAEWWASRRIADLEATIAEMEAHHKGVSECHAIDLRERDAAIKSYVATIAEQAMQLEGAMADQKENIAAAFELQRQLDEAKSLDELAEAFIIEKGGKYL